MDDLWDAIHIRLHPNNINRDSGIWKSRSIDAHDQETQLLQHIQENCTTANDQGNNTQKQQRSKIYAPITAAEK